MNTEANSIEKIKENYDVLVVGAGIVGAGVFRDLALHGVSTLIIDKKDFSSQTSRYSSKMLHGGIRYLENMDFKLVWEALHEKNLWIKLAPHLVIEKRFYLPIFKTSPRPLWMIRAGLKLYDFLSGGQNTPSSSINAKELEKVLPGINPKGLKGAGIYSDAIMDDLKLTLEVIYDGLKEPNQSAINHCSIIKVNRFCDQDSQYCEVTLQDELTSKTKVIKVKDIVFCTGPFTDQLLPSLGIEWTSKLLPSKGSHIWISHKELPIKSPMVITGNDGRVIFVIPHELKILVGTTEVPIDEELFDPKASDEEIDYLLKALNEYFPSFEPNRSKVLGSFAGIRPLVKEDGSDRGKTSREHKDYQPCENIYVLIGGKYTTFRTMAHDITSKLLDKYSIAFSPKKTMRPLRQKSLIGHQDWHKTSIQNGELKTELMQKVPLINENELVRCEQDLVNRIFPWPDLEGKDKLLQEIINQSREQLSKKWTNPS